MGKITKGILGGFSGTVGSVVGGNWRGIDYIRTKPDHVFNPKTPKQVAQRLRFAACTKFVRSLMNVIVRPVWNRSAVRMSGYNYCTQKNIDAFDEFGQLINLNKLTLTVGPLVEPEITAKINATDVKKFDLSWNYNQELCNQSGEDLLHIIYFDTEDVCLNHELIRTAAIRRDGSCKIDFAPDAFVVPGVVLGVFFYFGNADNSKFSKSQYLTIEIPL